MSGHISRQLDGGILSVTIDRIDKKNSLTQTMYAGLVDALQLAATDPAVKVIHLTGAGDVFTAGNDIADFADSSAMGDDPPVNQFLRALPRVEVPIVVAVNGLAIGVGVTLLLHCDFVYASDKAIFSTPFVDLALVPEAGSSLLMPRQMGYLHAARMLLLGEKLDATQALAAGLVSEVVAHGSLQEKTMAVAQALAAKPPTALRAAKRLLRLGDEPLAQRMDLEMDMFAAALRSPEAAEAMAAFFERRPADFSRFA
jgi:enoyl-CoA hydratase/carnithine racemase